MSNGGITYYVIITTNVSMRNDLTAFGAKELSNMEPLITPLLKNNRKFLQYLLISPTINIKPLINSVSSDIQLNYLSIRRPPVILVVFLLAILLSLSKFPKHTNLFLSLYSHHIIYFPKKLF